MLLPNPRNIPQVLTPIILILLPETRPDNNEANHQKRYMEMGEESDIPTGQ